MHLPGTDLDVFPICLGTAGWGTGPSVDESRTLLDIYLEAGGNFFDTAHCYAFWIEGNLGKSEQTLGRVADGHRDKVVIATKGGHPDGGPLYPRPDWFLDPELVHRDIQESLERLGTDRIDLYYLHRDDGKTPVREIIDALNEAKGVRYLGASNWSAQRVEEANRYARSRGLRGFVALQNQWSLATPTWEPTEDPTVRYITESDAAWLRTAGIACIPYSSTANGYFAKDGQVGDYQTDANRHRLSRAVELANTIGATPNQVALAWLMAQDFPVIPIVGTENPDHLRDAVGSVAIKLNPEQRNYLLAS